MRTANWSSGCMLKTSTGSLGRSRFTSCSISSPLRPGIVISSTSTSQCSFAIRISASVALRAWPNTAFLKWSARINFNPCRTTAWSSAKRIFIRFQFVLPGMPARAGNAHAHGRALARLPAQPHFSAEQRGPLAHADQADRFGVENLRFGNAAPIVLDLQNKMFDRFNQPHLDPGGSGVADDVGERFLKNAEEGRVQVLIQDRIAHRHVDAALDAGLPLEFIRLALHRRRQPGPVEKTRPSFRGDSAEC